jgi:hypothetical protein
MRTRWRFRWGSGSRHQGPRAATCAGRVVELADPNEFRAVRVPTGVEHARRTTWKVGSWEWVRSAYLSSIFHTGVRFSSSLRPPASEAAWAEDGGAEDPGAAHARSGGGTGPFPRYPGGRRCPRAHPPEARGYPGRFLRPAVVSASPHPAPSSFRAILPLSRIQRTRPPASRMNSTGPPASPSSWTKAVSGP